MKHIEILFIGDIVGSAGRRAVKQFILNEKNDSTVVIANAENSAAGFGITPNVYRELLNIGVDILTGGNHIWDRAGLVGGRDVYPHLALPANLPKAESPVLEETFFGVRVAIINLSGQVFMTGDAESPFATFDRLYTGLEGRLILVDFHAEATSEKAALAYYIEKRAHALFGTHTHVQTADEQIIGDGLFFISDVGSCAAKTSILGMSVESSLVRFTGSGKKRMKVEEKGPVIVNACRVCFDKESFKVLSFERIKRVYE